MSAVADRLAYWVWLNAPLWLCNTKLGMWLLPYAGRHGYPDDIKEGEG